MNFAAAAGTPVVGGGTVRWHNSKDTQLATKRFRQALDHHQRDLRNLIHLRSEYTTLDEQLQVLPQSISHQIMVPFTSQAILPAKLVKTNEVTVLLGDNYFAKCSAHHARSIVRRRLDVVERKISEAEKQVHEMRLRLQHSLEMSSSEGVCEIMEPYQSDDSTDGAKGSDRISGANLGSVGGVEEEEEEENRSNIEETEARLRFLFGNEDEWVNDEEEEEQDDDNGSSSSIEDNQVLADGLPAAEADQGSIGEEEENEEMPSGVEASYLADFNASVQSRRSSAVAPPASSAPNPIVTHPGQLYDMLFGSTSPQQKAAAGSSSHVDTPKYQTAPRSVVVQHGPVAAASSGTAAVVNTAFTGRVVEKNEAVRRSFVAFICISQFLQQAAASQTILDAAAPKRVSKFKQAMQKQ
jgi:prefoldin alpha subunit